MKDYKKLVEALQCTVLIGIACPNCADRDCYANSGNGLWCRVPKLLDDAADAIEELQAEVDTLKRTDSKRCQECLYLGQPVGEQFMPKHGEWIRFNNPNYSPFDASSKYLYECPFCGAVEYKRRKHCPECGAKMRVQE